jgi:hypothetical protein
MNPLAPKTLVVNNLTGEVGNVITTHTYQPEDVEVVSVRFGSENARWVLRSCITPLSEVKK